MQCKSSGISAGENRISYVANAGPQNLGSDHPFNPYPGFIIEFGRSERQRRDAKMYTIFFDHCCMVGPWEDTVGESCRTKITVDNISAIDGTSNTILLSENEDAGRWIWYSTATGFDQNIPVVVHGATSFGATPVQADNIVPYEGSWGITCMESLVGFCFPNDLGSIPEEIPNYVPLMWGTDNERQPLFINEGRSNSGASIVHRTRTARPASAHPGVVVAAFVDGGVRTLQENMDKTLFVRLARPGSGVILNPKDLGW